jgi:hypothetical protein
MFSVNGRVMPAHVYAWRLQNGGISVPHGKLIKHSCDNKRCVNPKHLSAGTSRDNIREAFARTRSERVFSAREVSRIRAALKRSDRYTKLARSCSAVALAKKYGVGRSTINRIKAGQYKPY